MKPVFLIGGAEVAVLLAQGLAKHHAKPVFVANGLDEAFLKLYGQCIELDSLAGQLRQNSNSALLLLTFNLDAALLNTLAAAAAENNIFMLPNCQSLQRLQQEKALMQGLALEPFEYLNQEQVVASAQYLPYPLLLQGPLLDPNNFYQVLRKPKQLSWALDNAKALAITKLRLSCYKEVKTRFLLQAAYKNGQLQTPTVVGVNNEHGVLHEAWQGEPIPDHVLIKAQALLAKLAFMVAEEGIISGFFSVSNNTVSLQNFAPWPVLAGWVNHKTPHNVFEQQLQLLLQRPLLAGDAQPKKPAAIKIQAVANPAKPCALLNIDFGKSLLFYQQSDDVREALRDVIIAANNVCR